MNGHPPECCVIFDRGGGGLHIPLNIFTNMKSPSPHFISFDKIPVPAIEIPKRRYLTFLYTSLSESCTPQNKTVIKGASPCVSDEF